MTSDRSYREAMSEEVAEAELRAGAGSQFDPDVVRAFLDPAPSSTAIETAEIVPDR
jgi:HD-GYP domain-containing protein (c-di-GMP phosphodiesterase class II)